MKYGNRIVGGIASGNILCLGGAVEVAKRYDDDILTPSAGIWGTSNYGYISTYNWNCTSEWYSHGTWLVWKVKHLHTGDFPWRCETTRGYPLVNGCYPPEIKHGCLRNPHSMAQMGKIICYGRGIGKNLWFSKIELWAMIVSMFHFPSQMA